MTLQKQRQIQERQDKKKAAPAKAGAGKASGRSAPGPGRAEPKPPLPRQHLAKPGVEKDMQLRPRFQAPHYRGSGKLQGFAALVTGAIPASGGRSPCCSPAKERTWPSST